MPAKNIKHINLIHCTHSDYGYTDHPIIAHDLQRRYIDIAIDAAMATMQGPPERKFYWTAEMSLAVHNWWQQAAPSRREEFLQVVAAGQLEVTALPINNAPFLNRREWEKTVHWLPEELWQKVRPQSAIQNDVNALPRAGAVALLNRGVRYLFMGINAESGGTTFKRPSAFWWKMPDGQRMFVWLGEPYYAGASYFFPESWRRGPVVEFVDTRYRPPRPGEIYPTDEASMHKMHDYLLERIGKLEADGYSHETLLLCVTNEWRMDGDPPHRQLADFVAAWNQMGFTPTLQLTTVTPALKRMEQEIGGRIPEHEGEWPDWWANGITCAPRELSASRIAKRVVAAAESPLWGPLSEKAGKAVEEIYEQLCLFDEHTWGQYGSFYDPDSIAVIAQYNEKSRLAYRPLVLAQYLLAQRVRQRLAQSEEGVHVANTTKHPWSGWITMPTSCLRGECRSVEDTVSGKKVPIELRPGLRPFERPEKPEHLTPINTTETFADNYPDMSARFWVEGLKGGEIRRLKLNPETVEPSQAANSGGPKAELDSHQWPEKITWAGMKQPLFLPGFGDFLSIGFRGFAPRWVAREVFDEALSSEAREKMRREVLEETWSAPAGPATIERTAHTTVYTQYLQHPRLKLAMRKLEAWNCEPRVRFTLRLNRISSEAPELLYVAFPLPCNGILPRISNGGMPFTPYREQFPGSCKDYFSTDDWVHYDTPDGHWLWASRDVPLVTFGGQHALERITEAPRETGRMLAFFFDNRWFTNFVADSHGMMELQFDLIWKSPEEGIASADELCESLLTNPQVIINPSLKEDPLIVRHLYQP